MEEIRDKELGIVGERYRSFLEFYRENDHRTLNALYAETGDGAADEIFEVSEGVMFSFEDTREALLYGTSLYHERFEQAKLRAWHSLSDKYEWLDELRFESDTHGQNVIVERHVLGHPKSFSRRRPNMRKRRSVRILYDAMCPASTPLETRIQAGCSVLAAVDALERIGYEVALSFVLAKYSGSNVVGDATLVLDIPLKDFGERMLPAKTEFPLASKSMLFHVGSWWAHRFPRTPVNYGAGEGYPLSYDKGRLADMRAYAEKQHAVYLSEDLIELKMGTDPVRVLEHVIEGMGEDRELLAHMRGKTPLSAGMEPDQGKLFSGWNPGPDISNEMGTDPQKEGTDPEFDKMGTDPEKMGTDPEVTDSDGSDSENDANGGQTLKKGDRPQNDGSQKMGTDPEKGESKDLQKEGTDPEFDKMGTDPEIAKEGIDPENGEPKSEKGGQTPKIGDRPQNGTGELPGGEAAPDDEGDKRPEGTNDTSLNGIDDGESSTGMSDSEDKNEDESEEEGERMGMLDKNEDGGMDFAQITKALEDEMADADPAMPQSAEEFVVMLRRRYMMFEQGDYLNMMIAQKMAKRKAKKTAAEREAPLSAPPVPVDAPTIDNVQFGTPRNTPFSMTNIPHRK